VDLSLVSWAGMRGVVTLAAAFAIPVATPERPALLFIALLVVAGTLLLQGATLPLVMRRLGLTGPDPAEDALQEAVVYEHAAAAGRDALEELVEPDTPVSLVDELRSRSTKRVDALWERLGRDRPAPSLQYAELREQMLSAERDKVLRIRSAGTVDHEVIERVLAALDVEESILERVQLDSATRDRVLVARPLGALCRHLVIAPAGTDASGATACEDCVLEGTSWVHLRRCLTCGHVGCCDSSERTHGTAHFRKTGHPVIRSAEPGEAWRWCYVDQRVG
jgi:CPA1 family monovalent cation:H+ antiporter